MQKAPHDASKGEVASLKRSTEHPPTQILKVMVLRDPVQRVISMYNHFWGTGSIEQVCKTEVPLSNAENQQYSQSGVHLSKGLRTDRFER